MTTVNCGHFQHDTQNTEVELNTIRCLNCGRCTDMQGRPLPPQPEFSAPSFQERKAAGEVQ